MKKERAKKVLQEQIDKYGQEYDAEGIEALKKAIKALEQQPILDTRQRERQLEMEYQHGYDKGWEEGRKALEQQPCEDCVSREAIKEKKVYSEERHEYVIPVAEIDWLPSVKPQQRWIPVSEGLPEEYIHVLCQFTLGGMGECYLAHGAFHVVGGLVMTCNEVIAWMPLPQPYKAEMEDSND